MDIIHNPRNYTRYQGLLVESLVAYIFGPERFDVKFAMNEITENIAILEEVAPKNLEELN